MKQTEKRHNAHTMHETETSQCPADLASTNALRPVAMAMAGSSGKRWAWQSRTSCSRDSQAGSSLGHRRATPPEPWGRGTQSQVNSLPIK